MTQTTTDLKIAAACAIIETIKEQGPHGVPGGFLYASLMGILTISEFEGAMQILCKHGLLRKQGHVYYYNH